MKKIRIAMASLAVAALLTVSCESDDNGPAAKIEGKWTPTKTIIISNGNQDVINYAGNQPGCDKDYREFVAGGSYRFVVWYLNATNDCTEDIISSTWSRSGDVLNIVDTNPDATIESPPDAGTYNITKLTGSELRLESTSNTGGVEVEVTQVFSRQ